MGGSYPLSRFGLGLAFFALLPFLTLEVNGAGAAVSTLACTFGEALFSAGGQEATNMNRGFC